MVLVLQSGASEVALHADKNATLCRHQMVALPATCQDVADGGGDGRAGAQAGTTATESLMQNQDLSESASGRAHACRAGSKRTSPNMDHDADSYWLTALLSPDHASANSVAQGLEHGRRGQEVDLLCTLHS